MKKLLLAALMFLTGCHTEFDIKFADLRARCETKGGKLMSEPPYAHARTNRETLICIETASIKIIK